MVRAVFGPQGQRVATGSLDQTARVWDAATGQALTPPLLHPWSVRHVHFSADGQHLLTSGSTGAVWSWELPCTDCAIADLVRLAQLLSGSRIDEHRGIMPLDPGELKDLWTSLRRTRSDFFHFSAEDVTAWHRQTAEECARGRHWSAALWHLDRLMQKEPDNWLHYAQRGRVRAELNQWTEARTDFAEVVRRAPQESEAWCLYAVLRLHEGDKSGYRRACAELWKQCQPAAPAKVQRAYLTAWTGVLAAACGIKGEQLVELANQSVERAPDDPDYLCTLGAALFRAGDLASANRRLNEALALRGNRPSPREWLWLSLVYSRRESPKEARQWLDKATAFLTAPAADHTAADAASLPWVQRLQLELLRREAERLMKSQKTEPRP